MKPKQKMIIGTVILLMIVCTLGIIIFPKEKENPKTSFALTEEQKIKIHDYIQENNCTILSIFFPFREETIDFQDFNTRITTIRDYIKSQHMIGKLDYQDNVIYKEMDDFTTYASNTLIKIDYLKEYYQKLFLEELDETKLNPEKIWESYYDTGISPDGGCLNYHPILNKVEYDETRDIYTIYLLEISDLVYKNPEKYANQIQMDDEFLKENQLEDTRNILKIEFRWIENQMVLLSSKSTIKK